MPQIDETKPISQIGKSDNINGKAEAEGLSHDKESDSSPEEQASVTKNSLENINIRTMPKKFKVSSEGQDGKTKVVGAIIMIVGAFVLIALVYLAYIYLIKPVPKKAEVQTPAVVEEETREEVEKPKVVEEKQEPVKKQEPVASKPKIEDVVTTTPEVATTTEEITTTEDIAIEVVDTDSDGLSDKEEEIFGSNKDLLDTDSDGYEDLSELENLYNPAGEGILSNNPNIEQYESASYNYSTLRPSNWLKQDIAQGSSVIFGAIDGSFIQIISQANSGLNDIKSWYQGQFPEKIVIAGDIMTKDGWQGIFHENKKIFYLTDSNKKYIFVISYVPEPEENMDYYNIFKMMINSFVIK